MPPSQKKSEGEKHIKIDKRENGCYLVLNTKDILELPAQLENKL